MRRAAGPALAAAALLAAGCAGGGAGDPGREARAAAEPFRAKLQSATCEDWRRASAAARRSAVDRLEQAVAGPRGEGRTLPDALASSTLDARCKPDFARGFLLYELYIRAAAFSSPAD